MSNESILERNIRKFREFIQQREWTIGSEGEIQSGYQFRVTDGQYKIPVNFYTTGKVLIQGKAGSLQNEIQNWWKNLNAPASPSKEDSQITPVAAVPKISSIGLERIGIDEAAVLEKIRMVAQKRTSDNRLRQSGHASDGLPEIKQADRLEKRIISLMLQFPEILPEITKFNVLEYFEDKMLKDIGSLILKHKNHPGNQVSDLIR